MTLRALAPVLLLTVSLATPSPAATRTHRNLTITADESRAHPGGFLDVRLRSRSRRGIRGVVYAVLDGRRNPAYPAHGGLRALVPVPVTFWPGQTTLGIEIRTARGRQRIPVPVTIAERVYPARNTVIPEPKRAAIETPAATRDGRELQQQIRTVTPDRLWQEPFREPVNGVPATNFGAPQTYEGGRGVEMKIDATWGEYHRGVDYAVPVGTVVRAPAAGRVIFAGPLTLSGRTVVLDHGQGLVSVLYHLDRVDARTGDRVSAGTPVGASGESGIAGTPHLHWGVYLNTVAIDPRLTLSLD